MTDLNDLIAKTIGEIAGKVIEKSIDLGDKFIERYFRNHKPKVKVSAAKNAQAFLILLSEKINLLEQTITDKEAKKRMENILNSPDFSKVLEQSIKISSLSEDKDKKDILAQLIIHRLLVDTDTTEALVVKMTCEKIEYLNNNHLKLLGLIYTLKQTKEHFNYDNRERPRFTREEIKKLLIERFKPYYNVTVNQLELENLEFHNCVKMNYGLTTFLEPLIIPSELWEVHKDTQDVQTDFFKTNLGHELLLDWANNNLQHAVPSIVGQLIGQYVHDLVILKNNVPRL